MKLIKYSNRKLYLSKSSEYVSLDDVYYAVRGGETVKVTDYNTKNDVTADVLRQAFIKFGKTTSEELHKLMRI